MKGVTVILFLIGSVAESLKLYRVHVPHYRLEKEDALLECDYELGNARLYAVKWYKDNEEFFRYVPRFKPPIKTHKVEGVSVDISESDSKGVLLKGLDFGSTGVYRCEISAEAPYFLTVHGEGRMTVVHLPKEGPQINGNLQDEYEIGDILDLNCTSSSSFPPAKISWYINDLPVEVPWVVSTQPAEIGIRKSHAGNSLTVSTLRLHVRLSAHHFSSGGSAKVRCVASISTLFWEDGNEIAVGNSKKYTATTTSTANQHPHTNHNHYNSKERDFLRLDSSSSSSSSSSSTSARRNYYDSNNNLTPNPFIFNSTALVTVRGTSGKLCPSTQLVTLTSFLWLAILFLKN